jgi:hypothetical protein
VGAVRGALPRWPPEERRRGSDGLLAYLSVVGHLDEVWMLRLPDGMEGRGVEGNGCDNKAEERKRSKEMGDFVVSRDQ